MVRHFKESYLPVVDFGSQTTNSIARRIREHDVYSEILPHISNAARVLKGNGVILSGGPSSVYEKKAPKCNRNIVTQKEKDLLGICYGMQLGTKYRGGKVRKGKIGEYGETKIRILKDDPLFKGLPREFTVWMSHGDEVRREDLPEGSDVLAVTEDGVVAAYRHENFRGVQFHPEVDHTQYGREILRNFALNICEAPTDWTTDDQIGLIGDQIREEVGDMKVAAAVSGGGDSTVMAYLLKTVLGEDNVAFIYVDHGLQRKGETEGVIERYSEHIGIDPIVVYAQQRVVSKLVGVDNPETVRRNGRIIKGKRIIIGGELGDIIVEEAMKLHKSFGVYAQGTLYPDVIESMSPFKIKKKKGPSKKIKSHHNTLGLRKKIRKRYKILEPFKWLFKDEMRKIGLGVGLPEEVVVRQPFPGPGLSIRYVTRTKRPNRKVIREVLSIAEDFGYVGGVSEILTVGVQGDGPTNKNLVYLSEGERDWDVMREAYREIVTRRLTNRIVYRIAGADVTQASMMELRPMPISTKRLNALREANEIITGTLDEFGVQYDQAPNWVHRGHDGPCIVSAPKITEDYMTARPPGLGLELPWECADKIGERLMRSEYIRNRMGEIESFGIEIGDKPPGTIEPE